MKLLVLGGPRFLGRAIADAALARGHELTFFNRGLTNPELTRRPSGSSEIVPAISHRCEVVPGTP